MVELKTGAAAGVTGEQQIQISLKEMAKQGGSASIGDLYHAVEAHMHGAQLSEQGKASLRYFINKVAVKAGYVYPAEPNQQGWRITAAGLEAITVEAQQQTELIETPAAPQAVAVPSNTARGSAFEAYILRLLKVLYPHYAWYHQGQHKSHERGLDFIGSQVSQVDGRPQFIGVQVKLHADEANPAATEWLKFLAGCFTRKIDQAIFITSGRLTSEQRREAGEARVVVIEGRKEITRIAKLHDIPEFDLYQDLKDEPVADVK